MLKIKEMYTDEQRYISFFCGNDKEHLKFSGVLVFTTDEWCDFKRIVMDKVKEWEYVGENFEAYIY